MMTTTLRPWATPLAIGSFTISAVTGLLIFFDIEMGMIEPVHKWLSWLLVGAVGLHTISNWKSFTGYFSRKTAQALMGAAVVVTVLSVLPFFGEREEEGKHGGAVAAAKALEFSSLETVALVTKTTPRELVARLEKIGVTTAATTMTLREIAERNGKDGRAVLGAVLGARGEGDGDER
jgi:hypothetical protein